MTDLTDDQFYKALDSEDSLGLVLRAHLHIEYHLNVYIRTAIPGYEAYAKKLGFGYKQKVLLCCALGLADSLQSPLLALGTLRNDFAHKPEFQLTNERPRALYETLSEAHKAHLQSAYSEVAQRFARQEKSYQELPERQQLTLILMLLRKKVLIAIGELKNRQTRANGFSPG